MTLPAERGHFGPPIFLDMLAACGERLAEEGLDLMLVPTMSRTGEMETYRRLIEGRRADAMIVVRTYQEDERVAYLNERGHSLRHAWAYRAGERACLYRRRRRGRLPGGHPRSSERSDTGSSPISARRRT